MKQIGSISALNSFNYHLIEQMQTRKYLQTLGLFIYLFLIGPWVQPLTDGGYVKML